MTVPLILLAVGSVGAGAFLVGGERLAHWLEPSFGRTVEPDDVPRRVLTSAWSRTSSPR